MYFRGTHAASHEMSFNDLEFLPFCSDIPCAGWFCFYLVWCQRRDHFFCKIRENQTALCLESTSLYIQQEVLNSIHTNNNILIRINAYKNISHLSGICGLGLKKSKPRKMEPQKTKTKKRKKRIDAFCPC